MQTHHRKTSLIALLVCAAFLLLTLPAFAGGPDSFAPLVEKYGDTVVNIYTTQTVKEPPIPYFPFQEHQGVPEFFKKFFEQQGQGYHGQVIPQKRTSLGSGVIISADGYIITNNHVIDEADEINVRFANHEEYEAKIIGRDSKTDVALIKIDPKETLPYATFGDSEKLRVGDWVIAIGNPFGFEQTVTAGIVSGKGRTLGSGNYENFIQTDASINPGNSGGPLFNMDGEMVGINTAIYSRSGGNIGIGFAIPINMAKNVIEQLKTTGKVTRGWLGVMIQNVSQDLAKQFGLEKPIGALIGEVSPGSPAEKAGILPGDIIVEYKGKEITQMNMLPTLVAQTPVGETVNVALFRNGKKKNVSVTVAKLEEDETAAEVGQESVLGLTVQQLTPELAQSLKIKDKEGIIVANVEPGSAAEDAGLRPGDLILEVNRQEVRNMEEYNKAIANLDKKESILLLVKRDAHTRFVVLEAKLQ
ncbi:MAG: DegQ family serine endoprotease [Proteobacteria bacterium]|nr:DegQ family serine endoprotease [Pseudomonadota bacterium]MBU4296187.1 DegQ family serine endoprotease [Pseudomonadota bacterium]MCG2749649.1 DegQ family serine endoprotease [Desulfobulbaceae bacterium]